MARATSMLPAAIVESLDGGHDPLLSAQQRYTDEMTRLLELDELTTLQAQMARQEGGRALALYGQLLNRLGLQRDRVQVAERYLRDLVDARQQQQTQAARRAQITADLLAAYGHLGPQYRLLCQAVAAAQVRVEDALASTLPERANHWKDAVPALTDVIKQLQKHNESLKTETVRHEVEQYKLYVVHQARDEMLPEAYQRFISKLRDAELAPPPGPL